MENFKLKKVSFIYVLILIYFNLNDSNLFYFYRFKTEVFLSWWIDVIQSMTEMKHLYFDKFWGIFPNSFSNTVFVLQNSWRP